MRIKTCTKVKGVYYGVVKMGQLFWSGEDLMLKTEGGSYRICDGSSKVISDKETVMLAEDYLVVHEKFVKEGDLNYTIPSKPI